MATSTTTGGTGSFTTLPAPATSSTTPAATSMVKEFTVTGKNFSFAPNTITVNNGDTVKITFKNESGFHDLKIDEFNAATKQIQAGAQETITFVANKTGSFEYYCSVGTHRQMGMKGTLVVK
jgi:nitrite reductase (NO-forming)